MRMKRRLLVVDDDLSVREAMTELLAAEGYEVCLLYTSDAADDLPCVDIGGRRIIKKNTINKSAQSIANT